MSRSHVKLFAVLPAVIGFVSVRRVPHCPVRFASAAWPHRTASNSVSDPAPHADDPVASAMQAHVVGAEHGSASGSVPKTEQIRGTVTRIVFRSSDGKFAVVKLRRAQDGSAQRSTRAGSNVNMRAAASELALVTPGDALEVDGSWTRHAKFGKQFAVTHSRKLEGVEDLLCDGDEARADGGGGGDDDAHTVTAWLSSGVWKGVGRTLAERIVAQLGARSTLDAIDALRPPDSDTSDATPDGAAAVAAAKAARHVLLSVRGISERSLEALAASEYFESARARKTVAALVALGLPLDAATELWHRHGDGAHAALKLDPYAALGALARGKSDGGGGSDAGLNRRGGNTFGFRRCDALALGPLNLTADAPARLAAGVLHALNELTVLRGDCCAPASRVFAAARDSLVCVGYAPDDIALRAALGALLRSGRVVAEPLAIAGDVATAEENAVVEVARRWGTAAAERTNGEGGASRATHSDDGALSLWLPWLNKAERAIADGIARLANVGGDVDDEILATAAAERAIEAARVEGRALSPEQMAAVRCALGGAGVENEVGTTRRGGLVLLTGGAGTGKTFTVRTIVHAWHARGLRVALASPTARGARVLGDAVAGADSLALSRIGRSACTVHRLLEFNPREGRFARDEGNPLEADAVVIDEASMLDTALMGAVLRALPARCMLLLVGDADQLPSVGPGDVLRDLIACAADGAGGETNVDATLPGADPVASASAMASSVEARGLVRVTLAQIWRQHDSVGDIVLNAHLIKAGEFPRHGRAEIISTPEPASITVDAGAERPVGCVFLEAADGAAVAARVVEAVQALRREASYDVHDDLQVLSPMRRGRAGVHALNAALQEVLNPSDQRNAGDDALQAEAALAAAATAAASTARAQRSAAATSDDTAGRPGGRNGAAVRPGDRVIQLVNNYDAGVFNGEVGVVQSVDPEDGSFVALFQSHESLTDVMYRPTALNSEVALAYALTVHKAQGSEYPVVVVALAPEHAPMLQRELLYTALSRAQHLLVIVANRESLAACVARRPARGGARSTALAQRVRATLSTLAESPRPPQRAPLPAPSAGAGERMGDTAADGSEQPEVQRAARALSESPWNVPF